MYDLIDRNQLLQWLKVSDFENYNGDECFRYTIREIENAPAVNLLISCSEQMMPDGAKVLVLLSNGEYFVMTRHGNAMSDGLRHLNDLQSVTHWMLLPEKPEGLNHG